jgi:iron(III) transport system substrate-binding protein
MPRNIHYLAAIGLTLGLGLQGASAQPDTLTLYSAQHPQVDAMLVAAFTKETGIKVRVHEGEGPDIASQIIQEGSASPADVFFTENSPELNLLDEKQLLAPVAPGTLAQIPAQYNAQDGNWLGVMQISCPSSVPSSNNMASPPPSPGSAG